MKSKKILIISLSALAVIVIGTVIIGQSGIVVSTGWCVSEGSGSVLWISNTGEPTVMNTGGKSNIFDGITTGDRILIIRQSAIAESYPGQVRVYACVKLSDGSISNIPEKTLDALRSLGWIE